MKKLVIFAHPNLNNSSRVNKAIFEVIKNSDKADYIDLSIENPNWDIKTHQDLMEKASEIIIQMPLVWFSAPGILKVWLDSVLTTDWAYTDAYKLEGKKITIAVTSSQGIEDYLSGNAHGFPTIDEFLNYLKYSFFYCKANYQDPYHVIGGAIDASDEEIANALTRYKRFLAI